MNFKEFINETIANLWGYKEIKPYADDIFGKLQKAYEKVGGIKGSGFSTPDEMAKKMKLIKITKRDSVITAGLIYKDKDFRKRVAIFTDGTTLGKSDLRNMLKADFERTVMEVSHASLRYIEKEFPQEVKKYAIKTDQVEKMLSKPIEIIDDYRYIRNINGTEITKRMFGVIKKFN